MKKPDALYLGIDVHEKHLTVAGLSGDGRVLFLEEMPPEELIPRVKALSPRVIGIDGPSGPSRGLALEPLRRKELGLRPGRTFADYKLSEIMLRKRGIGVYGTPRELEGAGSFYRWMGVAVALFDKLKAIGYPTLGASVEAPGAAEVFPHGVFHVLSGGELAKKNTPEGIEQRMTLLEGVQWGRSLDGLSKKATIDGLDALAAAYAARAIDYGDVEWLGDEREGQLALPRPPGVLPTAE